jgi:DNA primase
MAFISNEEINDIRAKANIVDIIGEYIPLQKKGKDYKCVCPFHDDHSPSMSVSESKQIYKCFSCNAAGNVFTFLQNYENISFLEAVKEVADKIGYHLTGTITEHVPTKYLKEHEIMNLTEMFFQNNLSTSVGINAKHYLATRGLNDDVIKQFGIGLSPIENDALANLLTKKGYEPELLENLGLINISNAKYYDAFTNRITFPINDINGNIVGFSCRIYNGEKDVAKYINTKETHLYKKGDILFNYYLAKSECKRTKTIIIVEGQMDAIRVYASGIKNVVALMGTALTKEQISLLQHLHSKVILCLDADDAGKKATILNGSLLTSAGIKVQVIRLADYKDPDEYILNKGVDAFQNNIENPIDFIDFKINTAKENINIKNTEELATYINSVIEDINKETDPILKEITLNKISQEYNLSIDVLKEKLMSIKKVEEVANEVFEKPKEPINNVKLDSLSKAIRKVLYYMMNDIKYIKIYQSNLGYFLDVTYRKIANEIVYYSEKNKEINVADFISYIEPQKELYSVVLEIINIQEELNQDNLYEYIRFIDEKSKEEQIKKLKVELKQEMDITKKIAITERIAEIKKGSVLDERD